MHTLVIYFLGLTLFITNIRANDILGCGGFVKSHVQIDFPKVEVKLLTKQGILKDKTTCAPNNGYYFLPVYEKGDYLLELNPPAGWSFNPTRVEIKIDRLNDLCTKGVDINFYFKGFGIMGRVESLGDNSKGPKGVSVILKSESEIRETVTSSGGLFSFSPVYPGHYEVDIKHRRWKLLKNKLQVTVKEGNTELPPNSFIVHGYSVSGFAKSEGESVSNATILLFSKNQGLTQDVSGCIKGTITGYKQPKKPLCYVKTDASGRFSFGSIPVGEYFITTFHQNQNIDVEPSEIQFNIQHDDVELETIFEIFGFSVIGNVVNSLDSHRSGGIPNVKIYINGKFTTNTDNKGSYRLEKLKTGIIKIRAEAENMVFEEVTLKISPNLQFVPDIVPNAFKICGKIDSEYAQTVTIVKVGSTFLKNVKSDPQTGKFCEYLARGTYEIQVETNGKGPQFYPMVQKVEVSNENDNIILFSQLKAVLEGILQCQLETDCIKLDVFLKPLHTNNEVVSTKIKGQTYRFTDVLPGSYKLSLSSNRFCWAKDTHEISINAMNVQGPTFIQSGYSVNFDSSHNTKVSYKLIGDSIQDTIDIKKGKSTYCLPKHGSYLFEYFGCHSYSNTSFAFNTQTESNEIKMEAVAHLHKMCLASEVNHGPVTVSIDVDKEKVMQGPLSYENGCFILEIILEPKSTAVILPQSDIYYFEPPMYVIEGKSDCSYLGQVFQAIKGHVYQGKIIPNIAGALMTLEVENGKNLTTETDSNGFYKFPPVDTSQKYKLTAEKESYQLVGPSENGTFTAYKLAQVIVEVLDELNKSPLQGTLLSLSGGLSYRSNLQTNENGKITFHSLSPSEYFLKPMMKEYTFEPSSKIINVKEGEVVNVVLIAKRIAYSAYGSVTSLNNLPEHNSAIEAIGVGNCSHLSEETTTEINGKFRLRGLRPYCIYHLKTKDPTVEKNIPEFIELKVTSGDVKDLHLIILRPKGQTKVLVRISSDSISEYAKTLKLNVYRKEEPSTLVHSIKLEANAKKESISDILIYVPSLQRDGKTYTLQLESTNQNSEWVAPSVSFVANSTFKLAQMEFSVNSRVTEQEIKQTSVWTFLLIISVLVIVCNVDVFKYFNINIDSLGSLLRSRIPTQTDYSVNDADIDQIVQNINSTNRKSKRNS